MPEVRNPASSLLKESKKNQKNWIPAQQTAGMTVFMLTRCYSAVVLNYYELFDY